MKKNTRKWWIVTIVMSSFMLFTAFYSLSMKEAFRELGFPDYFRIQLNTFKIIGAMLLLISQTPQRVREWIYAGFCIVLISASLAHLVHGDPAYNVAFPLIELALFVTGIIYLDRLKKNRKVQFPEPKTIITSPDEIVF